jgi:hypothetical protein
MVIDFLDDLNWAAVVVAALAAFAVGFVWYAPPVFGKYWAGQVSRYSGIPESELNATPSAASLALWLAGMAVNAVALALVADAVGVDSAGDGMVLGLVLGLGLGATVTSWPAIFARAPWGWWAVNSAAFLVMQVVIGAVLGAWQ